jgi:hypothetical protein
MDFELLLQDLQWVQAVYRVGVGWMTQGSEFDPRSPYSPKRIPQE